MTDLLVLGSDTDVGKTTFSLLWLAAFDDYDYWKPVETGDSDSGLIASLIGRVRVRANPVARFEKPVAPPLAARLTGGSIPLAAEIVQSRPVRQSRPILVETFGGPFSPLNEHENQTELIRELGLPSVFIADAKLGAIGRTLAHLCALETRSIRPLAVALFGPRDDFAIERLTRDAPDILVVSLAAPAEFTSDRIVEAAERNRPVLETMRQRIDAHCASESIADLGSQLIERDRCAIWHPYTSLQVPDAPLVVTSAQDEFLTLADGRRVIDAVSSWWTILHGHRFPPLMQALAEATTRFDHVYFAGVTHEPAIELAERMLRSMPWTDGRVFYSDDGSTAVEVALKMAYQHWIHRGEHKRTRFVCFAGGYHGDTFGAMSVGRDPTFFGPFEPLLFQVDQISVSADQLDETLRRRAGEVAAVIIEPLVQGAGGMLMHTPETLRQIRAVAREHGVLFIADEVMTGGGRTGTLWAHQAASIDPDLVCAGKTIAGGVLPIAATLAAPHVWSEWDTADRTRTFFHGHSFTAHPVACAVGVANWRLLQDQPLEAPQQFEKFWRDRLFHLRDWPQVKDVRIRGTLIAVEVSHPGGYLADVARQLRQKCLERGVLLRPLGNVLYAMPPLCTSHASLEIIAEAIERAVASVDAST